MKPGSIRVFFPEEILKISILTLKPFVLLVSTPLKGLNKMSNV